MTREGIGKVMQSGKFTEAEKELLACQYPEICHPGSFKRALFDAILKADPVNREKLALGFRAEVNAANSWQYGNLAVLIERVSGEGL